MKISLYLPNWVGDAVMATPALRALRDRFAGAEIVGVVRPPIGDVLAGTGLVDRIIAWHPRGKDANARGWRLIRALRAERFDLAVLFPNSLRSGWLAWCSGAKRRVGFARNGRGLLLTDGLAPKSKAVPHPIIDEYARLAEHLGCDNLTRRMELATLPQDETALDRFWSDNAARTPIAVRSGVAVRSASKDATVATGDSSGTTTENTAAIKVHDPNDDPHRTAARPPIAVRRASQDKPPANTASSSLATPVTTPAVLAGAADCGPADCGPASHSPNGYVCLNPGGAFGAAKHWPTTHFAELACRIATDLGKAVLVLCGPAERGEARQIARLANHPHVVSLADVTPSIGLTKAAVRRCDLLVTTDSGPRHFAAPFNVPVVTLFGPTHIAWSETYYNPAIHLQIPVDCGPCQKRSCPLTHHRCMTGLAVDYVYAVAIQQLERKSRRRAA